MRNPFAAVSLLHGVLEVGFRVGVCPLVALGFDRSIAFGFGVSRLFESFLGGFYRYASQEGIQNLGPEPRLRCTGSWSLNLYGFALPKRMR